MRLNDEERTIMVEFEMDKAHRLIDQFPILQDAKLWDTLANRVYYSVFHAVTALLIQKWSSCAIPQRRCNIIQQAFYQRGAD